MREWRSKIRKEQRVIDRQIRGKFQPSPVSTFWVTSNTKNNNIYRVYRGYPKLLRKTKNWGAVHQIFSLFKSSCVYMASPGIQTEEMKVKKSIKDAAKRGQVDVAKILAKEVVQSKKAVSKLYASKAQMNSVVMSMQQQLG